MSRPKPPTYRTTNWHEYNAALARRGSLAIWFDPATQWLASPTGKRGRQPVFTDAAIQTCLTLKALFGLPLRQTAGMVASLLELAGLDWPVPNFSTLCRRQKTLTVHIPYRPSTGALHLLIDSTGVKAAGDGEWLARKHGPSKPRDWRKVHLGIDAETLEIRAIEITGSRIGDAPVLPDLLDQIVDDQPLGIVTADGAYDTRACHRFGAFAAPSGATVPFAPSRRVGRRRSSRPARTASRGRNTPQGRLRATRRSAAATALAGPSGSAGQATTDEVWPRPRCGASSFWASASCPATSTDRSQSFRSGQRS